MGLEIAAELGGVVGEVGDEADVGSEERGGVVKPYWAFCPEPNGFI